MPETYPYVDAAGIRSAAYGMTIPSQADASIDRLVAKAGERLKARVPRLEARVDDGSLSKDLVAGVVEDMVLRVIRNPYGFAQEQAGEFMYRIDSAVASGAVQVTGDDLELLTQSGLPFGSMRTRLPAWRLP